MMLIMSTVIAYDSINLNAQSIEGGGGGEKVIKIKIKKRKRHMVQSHLENRWVFKRLRNAAEESAFLTVCGRKAWETKSLKKLRHQTVFCCVFQQHLESVGGVAMMSEGVVQAYIRE